MAIQYLEHLLMIRERQAIELTTHTGQTPDEVKDSFGRATKVRADVEKLKQAVEVLRNDPDA